jgi:hypothetical protein
MPNDAILAYGACVTCNLKKARYTDGQSSTKLFCIHHKLPESKYVETCKRCDCGNLPSYGMPGSKKRVWCAHCPSRDPTSIDVSSRMCEVCRTTVASFGKNKQFTRCGKHKLEGDVTRTKQCIACGLKDAKIGKPNSYCVGCAKMNNILDERKNMYCECKKTAHFGLCGKPATSCASCKTAQMVLYPTKRCVFAIFAKCREFAVFGFNKTRLHCEVHKHPNEVDLIQTSCSKCGLVGVLDANKNCSTCDPAAFVAFQVRHELRVKAMLDAFGFKYTIHNRVPNSTYCGLERPDFVFDYITYVVIIEVDEGQHKPRKCEWTRMFNLANTYVGIPVLFLRFNPDGFILKNKKKADVTEAFRFKKLRERH